MSDTKGSTLITMVQLDEYIELVKEHERLNAVIAYVHTEKYSPDKSIIYALAAREELMEESK